MESQTTVKSPLSVSVIRHGPLDYSEPFVSALRKTFTGNDGADTFSASDYELLNPVDFRVFSSPDTKKDPDKLIRPEQIKTALADQSEALLIILLLADNSPMEQILMDEWAEFARQRRHVFVLAVSLVSAERIPLPSGTTEENMVSLGLSDLDERDLRRDFLALHALNLALRLLSRIGIDGDLPTGKSTPKNRPRLFFSHAKRDGVPLSTALVSWLGRLSSFRFFYDSIDLDLSGDIGQQLEQAVANSVLVVLRTEIFDQRYWCQKEIFWAEKYGIPVITVDARWNLHHAPSVVSFDASPSVRIPDGSMVRILLSALTEAIRVALLRRRAYLSADAAGLLAASMAPLARFPSLVSLHALLERCSSGITTAASSNQPFFIVYPNPTMPDGIRDSVREVAAALIPGSQVLSLDEFRIRCLSFNP